MLAQARMLGDILIRQGALDEAQLEQALQTVEERGSTLADVLLATRVVEEDAYVRALANEVGLQFLTQLQADEIPEELIELVPINFARQHRVLPIRGDDRTVHVATANPLDTAAIDDMRALLGREIEAVACSPETIDDAINRVYERKDETALGEAREGEEEEELQDLIDMTDEAPVIRWVNNLFYNAVRDRASDIHIEPTEREVQVRCRIDGRLQLSKTAHRGFLPSIVSRVKIEAGLNIAEKRLPQDGRITKKISGKLVDVRVSTVPTAKGERVVMRMLDKEQVLLDLPALGFDSHQLELMEHLVNRPNGIILVTGPTGSGKTTTLYGCLNKINRPDRNILTVEDPVEYELPGIGQMQVQPKIGLTFAAGLRSFLRQDPDVIMVGEIRDHETADIAIHASLTGHLVLSTLHTNDAPGAITRLVDMGVQPFLISSSVMAVLAQRLVRRLCPHCREPYEPTADNFRELGIEDDLDAFLQRIAPAVDETRARESAPPSDVGDEDATLIVQNPLHSASKPNRPVFYRPRGCDECGQSGYRGRVGIFELMMVDEPVRREILNRSASSAIQRVAVQRGMRILREDGARQILAGATTLEEVLAATQAGEIE